jgi:TonB family protein
MSINKAVGPGVMDKPALATPQPNAPPVVETQAMRDLAAGNYDNLFPGASDKPSELYRASQLPPHVPGIRLVDSSPIAPDVFVPPVYPAIARMAHVQGTVTFTIQIDAEGAATNFVPASGSPLLHGSTKEATSSWKFPKAAAGQYVRASIEFKLNCDR